MKKQFLRNFVRQKLTQLKHDVDDHEIQLMNEYVRRGPDAVKDLLQIRSETEWGIVFDRLVLRRGLVKHTIRLYLPYFKHLVTEHGPAVIRDVFSLHDHKYDQVYEDIVDYVAVGHGTLYDHVYQNQSEYAKLIRSGKADFLRAKLTILDKRYDGLWSEILEILMKATCEQLVTDTQLEQGLKFFVTTMNNNRQQRSLRSFAQMWEFSAKK